MARAASKSKSKSKSKSSLHRPENAKGSVQVPDNPLLPKKTRNTRGPQTDLDRWAYHTAPFVRHLQPRKRYDWAVRSGFNRRFHHLHVQRSRDITGPGPGPGPGPGKPWHFAAFARARATEAEIERKLGIAYLDLALALEFRVPTAKLLQENTGMYIERSRELNIQWADASARIKAQAAAVEWKVAKEMVMFSEIEAAIATAENETRVVMAKLGDEGEKAHAMMRKYALDRERLLVYIALCKEKLAIKYAWALALDPLTYAAHFAPALAEPAPAPGERICIDRKKSTVDKMFMHKNVAGLSIDKISAGFVLSASTFIESIDARIAAVKSFIDAISQTRARAASVLSAIKDRLAIHRARAESLTARSTSSRKRVADTQGPFRLDKAWC